MSYWKERAVYWKSRNRCKNCGKQDAYTLAGRSYCYACNEHHNDYKRINKDKWIETEKKRSKTRYERLKQEGICVSCGKRPAKPNHIRCLRCSIKHSNSEKKRYQRKNY